MAFYFSSAYPCEGLAEICFTSAHPCEGLVEVRFSSAYPCEDPTDIYFASARTCEDLAEVCFVAKLTGEGPTDCHFVPDRLRADLTGRVWRLSELPEQAYLTISSIRKPPRCIYTFILISGKLRSIYPSYYKSPEYSDRLKIWLQSFRESPKRINLRLNLFGKFRIATLLILYRSESSGNLYSCI